ncbi:ankyrin repeat domain-containing protein 50-like, partial [Haliotis rufescens]|uniref:ankyrin repeat domain-containing protein 50-like n=1 Tax=Haliotis rufescens TaxID=6454 RepID=UPI00201F254F
MIFLSRYQQHKRDQKRKSGDNILLEACREGDLSRVQGILTEGHVDINSREREYGMTPVMLAARGGHSPLEIIKYILSRNITAINNRGIYGRTSVVLAACGGHRDVFDYLVHKGCNMSFVDNKGNNILHMACHGGHLAIVKYIMSLDIVDINSRGQYGRTSAMTAAYNGKSEVFKFLLGKGANVSLVDKAGDNILHISCRGGHVRMVKYIISLNIVDINSRGQRERTSVIMAALFGHREVFDICACAGGNVSQVDAEGSSILHMACFGGHVEMVKYIFSQNITDINSRGMHGMTPLHLAAREGHREVFELVVDKGSDTSLEDINGDNILHLACIGGNVEIVKYILSQNIVDINNRGMYERTPLMVAALFGHREAFELVLDKGGDTSLVDTCDVNILHLACIGGNVAIVKYILSQNFVDINSRGKIGRTPVMVAAAEGHIDLCYLLISKGSDLSVVDDNGCTILHVACYHGQVEIINLVTWCTRVMPILILETQKSRNST